MSILPHLSKVPVNLKSCFLAKSHVLSFCSRGELIVPRSIHSLTPPDNHSKLFKPAGLYSNLVFTRMRSKVGRKQKRPDPPTDFLPFPWTPREKFNIIENSGDREKPLTEDPALPKFGLDVTETLKDVDDVVRKQLSLETASKKELYEVNKDIILKKVQQHPVDFDSIEVTIALQTLRIQSLKDHCKLIRERRGKVALVHAIQKRNKNLNILRKVDLPRYQWLLKELNIQHNPSPLQVKLVPYNRKNELLRLTKEYCDKLVSEKRAAYHAELKEQQKLFLKEKEEVLAWIAEEEKALGIAKSNNESNV